MLDFILPYYELHFSSYLEDQNRKKIRKLESRGENFSLGNKMNFYKTITIETHEACFAMLLIWESSRNIIYVR